MATSSTCRSFSVFHQRPDFRIRPSPGPAAVPHENFSRVCPRLAKRNRCPLSGAWPRRTQTSTQTRSPVPLALALPHSHFVVVRCRQSRRSRRHQSRRVRRTLADQPHNLSGALSGSRSLNLDRNSLQWPGLAADTETNCVGGARFSANLADGLCSTTTDQSKRSGSRYMRSRIRMSERGRSDCDWLGQSHPSIKPKIAPNLSTPVEAVAMTQPVAPIVRADDQYPDFIPCENSVLISGSSWYKKRVTVTPAHRFAILRQGP
jgi:hypothetical protein